MYYVEHIYNQAFDCVSIRILGKEVARNKDTRAYKKATPGKRYTTFCRDGRVICVDAAASWQEANELAGKMARRLGTCYSVAVELIRR